MYYYQLKLQYIKDLIQQTLKCVGNKNVDDLLSFEMEIDYETFHDCIISFLESGDSFPEKYKEEFNEFKILQDNGEDLVNYLIDLPYETQCDIIGFIEDWYEEDTAIYTGYNITAKVDTPAVRYLAKLARSIQCNLSDDEW